VSEQAPEDDKRKPAPGQSSPHGIGIVGISIIVFFIGVVVGVPIANFGANVIVEYAGQVFGLLFGVFLLIVIAAGLIGLFRRRIWNSLFKRAEVEVERFARPLADVAKFAAEQRVAEATDAARDLAEMVLARYAWVSTRRWLLASITGLIAAIAALAGSALLFQQNQLLRTQIDLMGDQNARIEEQNRYIQSQIELGEAQRSTSIVPEILDIGAAVAREVELLAAGGNGAPAISDLSPSLRARIVAATSAARPYRYLRTPLDDIDEQLLMASGLLRRTDLAASEKVRAQFGAGSGNVQFSGEQTGAMSDRPLSPERGQIMAILIYNRLTDFQTLIGADFSFAEVRSASMASQLRFSFASLRFSNFDRQLIVGAEFNGAYLEQARFRNATINSSQFGVGTLPSITGEEIGFERGTQLSGTDFSGAIIKDTGFAKARGFGLNFDRAVLHKVQFTEAEMAGSTFRASIFGEVDFTGANLASVDFDGALVFDPAFLDKVARQAAPDGFKPDFFVLEAITPEQFSEHPRWADAWLDGLEEKQAYRVKRVGEFK
jgi:uncharacterized protein YjbI with pentapeptide repeats